MKIIIYVGITALLLPGCGGEQAQPEINAAVFDHEYSSYGRILGEFVFDGRVDYAGLLTQRSPLDSLVGRIGGANFTEATDEQKLAFYINAYNILTLRSIIDAYPVESIKDIDGVWDKKKWLVAHQQVTLNELEHEILRKQFSEPRIHLAINCASIGCPPLAVVPYLADSLEVQLERVSRAFAESPNYTRLNAETKTAVLSSIFDWFGEDFIEQYYQSERFTHVGKKANAALGFIFAHLPDAVRDSLGKIDFTVTYLDYDWDLNRTP